MVNLTIKEWISLSISGSARLFWHTSKHCHKVHIWGSLSPSSAQFVTLAVSTHEHPRNIQQANRPDFSSLLYGPTLNYWSAFLLKRNIHTIHLEWLFTISSTRILYYCFSSNDMFFYLNYWNQVVATQRLTNKTGKTVPPSVHSMVLHKLLKMTWKL